LINLELCIMCEGFIPRAQADIGVRTHARAKQTPEEVRDRDKRVEVEGGADVDKRATLMILARRDAGVRDRLDAGVGAVCLRVRAGARRALDGEERGRGGGDRDEGRKGGESGKTHGGKEKVGAGRAWDLLRGRGGGESARREAG
jgi:hypothetical protein